MGSKLPKSWFARRGIRRLGLVVLAGLASVSIWVQLQRPPVQPQPTSHFVPTRQPSRDPFLLNAGRHTLLLLGTDARPGEPMGNADAIIVCSLDYRNRRIELLSVPRDTKIAMTDGRNHKINETLALGGPLLTQATVEELVGQPIDGYVLTRFHGLVEVIDSMGGVNVYVPERMWFHTGDTRYGLIDLRPGYQHLSGSQALGFVRFRHDQLGDIGRNARQQAFLKAVIDQAFTPRNIGNIPKLQRQVIRTFETNVRLSRLTTLAIRAQDLRHYAVIRATLPGSFHDPAYPGDASYWLVNPREARYVAKMLFEDGRSVGNPVQDLSKTVQWTPPHRAVIPPPANASPRA